VDEVVQEAAQLIADGHVICWFQGGSEFGPRALGHRSILGSPLRKGVKDYINSSVKYRELFRPLAPSVLGEKAIDYFEMQNAADECSYMLRAVPIRPEHLTLLHEVSHVDGTARVQTVYREDNTIYYDLIQAVGGKSGLPIVLNTSFNTKGQPIVESPQEAVDTFLMMNLDALVIGNYMVTLAAKGMTEDAVLMWNHDAKLTHERAGGTDVFGIVNHRTRYKLDAAQYRNLLLIDGVQTLQALVQSVPAEEQGGFLGLIKTLLDKRLLTAI
ncbi:MAG: carbamoyltransferase C-terminal domain-containing protein, partial [Tumebacillaceae bacterium]